jgi:predicted nucleic acid-binding protein
MIAVFDSNIVIDFLNGIEQARTELAQYKKAYISPITWLEVQVKAPEGMEEATRAAVDNHFQRLELDEKTLIEGLLIRRQLRLKLPDALILASARVNGWLLVSRNTKDFPATLLGVRVPYELPSTR